MTLWYLSFFSFWLGPILCFDTAFLHQCSYFFSLTWAMMGTFWLCCCCLFPAIVYSLAFKVSDQVRAGTAPARWRGTSQYVLHEGGGLPAANAREWLTLLRHSLWLWLVVLSWERWILANQIRATGRTHNRGFYTADLYLILLSDHNHNFCKYNQKDITEK